MSINTLIILVTLITQGCNMNFKDTLNESVFNLLEAGGQAAGKLEVISTPLETIRKFALSIFPTLDTDIPNFDKNYAFAKKVAKKGSEKRKDMPVITDADVKMLQHALKAGKLDINAPFGKDTNKSNPYPQGISGKEAKKFLEAGLQKNDGDRDDDKVKVKATKERIGDLKPIQKQIYADKSVGFYTFGPIKSTRQFLSNKSFFIISSDLYIIDGHHRWLAGVLLDPDMTVNCLKIDIPKAELVKLLLAYGDAIGNSRNQ